MVEMNTDKSLVALNTSILAAGSELNPILNEWIEHLDLLVNTGEISSATRQTYREGLRHFLDWHQGKSVTTQNTIREWVSDLRGAFNNATVRVWFSGLRAFFVWATDSHYIPNNPTDGIKLGKRTDSRKHKRSPLTDIEVRRVLAAPNNTVVGTRDRAILYTMAFTAARTVEIHRLDLKDVHTEGNSIVLDVYGKGEKEADQWMVLSNHKAQTVLYEWLSVRGDETGPLFTSLSPRTMGKRLSLSAIREMIKSYYKVAGVTGGIKTTHSLRHSAITNAIKHKLPPTKAQSMARHKSLETTMIYYHEEDRKTNPAEEYIDYGE